MTNTLTAIEERTFGIELEVSTKKKRHEVERILKDNGIENWSVKYDGSIVGWEIVSPPLKYTQQNLDTVTKVSQILRSEVKGRATKKCGMHVHQDISDFNLEQLERAYILYERYQNNAMKTFIDSTRYNNQYCNPISPRQLSKIRESGSIQEFMFSEPTRYRTLNIKAFVRFGTLEFRQHQSSTDWLQTLAWVEITKAIVETAADLTKELPAEDTPRNNGEALKQMIEELGLSNNQTVVKSTARSYKFRLKAGDAS